MAATRAAELTVAYTTLCDAALRVEYDAASPPVRRRRRTLRRRRARRRSLIRFRRLRQRTSRARSGLRIGSKARFASERADRDVILKRAIAGRVLGIVEALYGKFETPAVRGFDLAIVPVARPRFLGAPPPRVLIRILDKIDGAAFTDATAPHRARACTAASRRSSCCCSRRHIASPSELTKASDANARHHKAADAPKEVAVVAVNMADWSCLLPPNCSPAVHKLTDQIRS